MVQEHRPREETRELILQTIRSSPAPLTRTEIARAIGRVKSPHLIELIDSLVEDNLLHRETMSFHNGVEGYIYSLKASKTSTSSKTARSRSSRPPRKK